MAPVFLGLFWLQMMDTAESAIQEAARPAMAAALLIGQYILARAASEVLGHVGAIMQQ